MNGTTRRAVMSLLLAGCALLGIASTGPARAQTGLVLGLFVSPDPVVLGETFTLTAFAGGVSELTPIGVEFYEGTTPGCGCGTLLGTGGTIRRNPATLEVSATSPPLKSPILGTHHLLARGSFQVSGPGFPPAEARTTVTVVCPAGTSPDPTGNACAADYPLTVSLADGAAAAPGGAPPLPAVTSRSVLSLAAVACAMVALIAAHIFIFRRMYSRRTQPR